VSLPGGPDVEDRARTARRKVALAVSIVATLALLCCGGSVSAFFLGGIGDEDSLVSASFDCGGSILGPGADLPAFANYSPKQINHALTIVRVGDEKNVPVRGWVIAIATALVESNLKNYANDNPRYPQVRRISMSLPHDAVGHDHDSVGLFQQRPVEGDGGWGTVRELMTPEISARKFYDKLLTIRGWQTMRLTDAAQAVQISGFPDAYGEREDLAASIVNALTGGAARRPVGDTGGAPSPPPSPDGDTGGAPSPPSSLAAGDDSVDLGCAVGGEIASSGWTVPVPQGVVSGFRTASRPSHQGVDLGSPKGVKIFAAAAGVVSIVKCDETSSGRQDCDVDGYPGKGGCGWMVEVVHADRVMTRYCHMVQRPPLRVGQRVKAGEVIGLVGSSGNSSGPHLHFEVHLNNNRSSSGAVDPVRFMRERGAPLGGNK
jgi:murein DD-endopeptidase MepM/ murein hydrolase activator NlpD